VGVPTVALDQQVYRLYAIERGDRPRIRVGRWVCQL